MMRKTNCQLVCGRVDCSRRVWQIRNDDRNLLCTCCSWRENSIVVKKKDVSIRNMPGSDFSWDALDGTQLFVCTRLSAHT